MNHTTMFTILVAVLSLAAFLTPEPVASQVSGGITGPVTFSDGKYVALLRLAYLMAFASTFGSSLWVTFIGGIIQYKVLPRHQFGNLQAKSLPVYFRLVSISTSLCLAAFALLHPLGKATPTEKGQLAALGITLAATLLNILILEPATTAVMKERHKIEREEGIGAEVGLSKNREVAKGNTQLAAINKRFGMYHGMSSLANLFSFGGILVHTWYLACRLIL